MLETRQSLEQRLSKKRKLLAILEKQLAGYTELEVPVSKLAERDQLRAEIAHLEKALQEIEPPPIPPPPPPSPPTPIERKEGKGRGMREWFSSLPPAAQAAIVGTLITALCGLIGALIGVLIPPFIDKRLTPPVPATVVALVTPTLTPTPTLTNTPTATPTTTPTPTATASPTPTPTLTPACGFAVTENDIPYVAPQMAGGSPFVVSEPSGALSVTKNCDQKRPGREYSVELSISIETTPQPVWFVWGISFPAYVSDLSDWGVLSFWLKGQRGGEILKIGLTDNQDHVGGREVTATSEWVNVVIPMAHFQEYGVDLHRVKNVFVDLRDYLTVGTIYMDEIAFLPTVSWDLKGVSLAGFDSDVYTSPESVDLVNHFKELGANYVSVLATWYQDGQEATEIRAVPGRTPTDESLEYIINCAHDQGLGVLLYLQVDDMHMSSHEQWRGHFKPANRNLWFESYKDFVVHYACLAQRINQEANDNVAKILNIGTEQVSLTLSEEDVEEWVEIVREARRHYTGQLMYTMERRDKFEILENRYGAAALDEGRIEKILAPLWAELDYAGTTAHYTLSTERMPAVPNLVNGWESHKAQLQAWASSHGKPMIFTTVCYRSVDCCAQEPWRWPDPLCPGYTEPGDNPSCQESAYEAFLQVFGQEDWVAGAFWWHYTPQLRTAYSPFRQPADNVVHRWYGGQREELPLLPSTVPPAPTQTDYDLESKAIMWVPQEYADTQAITAVIRNVRPETGDKVLELTTNLIGEDPNRKQGEILADLRYSRLPWTSEPAPYDMRDKEIKCWIYAPQVASGLTVEVFAKSLEDIEGSNWQGEYGSPVPIEANEWITATLTPSRSVPRDGYMDPDFNPETIVAIGLRIRGDDESRYDGSIYVDACSW